jgi:hypothetical protein
MVAGSQPVLVEKRCESEGRFPSGRSSSTRSIRCMGKKTTAGLNDSPSFTISTRSSKDANSTPLRLSPSGDSERIMPQNLSRGLPSVTTTRHPGKKGSRGALKEVGSPRWELSCINDCRCRSRNFATGNGESAGLCKAKQIRCLSRTPKCAPGLRSTMTGTLQHAQICPPRAHHIPILVGHYAGQLMHVGEIVYHPRRQ